MNGQRRARWLAFLCGPALALAAPTVTPNVLRPDAKLPDIAVTMDFGARNYDRAEERRYAAETVKVYNQQMGLINDPAQQQRIETIAHRIITAAVALGPKQMRVDPATPEVPDEPQTFVFRILNSDEINAFSVWDGNIYITRGMLEFTQSDDELAGILGHEVGHTMFHHLRDDMFRAQRYNYQELLALLASAFMGVNVGNIAGIVQYVHLALMNGHSVQHEAQADWSGCLYTYRAGYNPVGMITCFERLYRLYRSRPHVKDLGAFQTHPWSEDRAAALEKQIRGLGLPVDRRQVTNGITAGVRATPGKDGAKPKVELLLGDTLLVQLADESAEVAAEDRAADAALAINRALSRGLRPPDLMLTRTTQGYAIRAAAGLRVYELFVIQSSDAGLAGQPLDKFAQVVFRRFVARCRQEEMNHGAI